MTLDIRSAQPDTDARLVAWVRQAAPYIHAFRGRTFVIAFGGEVLEAGSAQALIHDIALQNLPVMMAIDRAGLVGADGATHHGAFDISYLLCVPNLTIFCPADEIGRASCRERVSSPV